ncbi:hypothetical protein N431DRAFT_482543 [Stipitochalara longipes BDJ]|nr:hypothetical protein N431DRAFT_482543 [Stipitochalara longipes BDJ]
MVSQQPELIAIVGSGCRFPGGANSPSKALSEAAFVLALDERHEFAAKVSVRSLWKLLQNPRDVLKDISLDRFDPRGYYHPDGIHHGTTNVRQSYLLDEDLRVFDSTFFNISPNEADSMDPQQRLLLETVYEALESGGHTIESLAGSDTAVYVGNMAVDYHDTLFRDLNSLPTYFATGTARSILSNRISYFFDWRGPSITIDTACSSSLIAVHQGVQALRTGETRVAVACGTQLILGPENYVAESKINLLSPTSRSRMWDADVDGYARGEGVATVVLKRLSDALADGDHIECLIRGTGTNQDGRSAGLTVPSSESQAALIANTYARAGLDLKNIEDWPQYFEAHGTGTRVGDPKEAGAISACFSSRSRKADDDPLYVGSIKTVIGHTEGTAGIAGLLKGSLAIQHGVIPPNLLFQTLNPDIKPFYQGLNVPTSAKPWPTLAESAPRRVSVNSFGFGGANAHAILEQYQPSASDIASGDANPVPWTPFTFSAVSESSLVSQLEAYSEFLKRQNALDPFDLAWTLQSRRSQFPIKAAFSAPTIEQLTAKIDKKLESAKQTAGTSIGNRSTPASPHILGIFTGQGAQWASMGANLIRSSQFVRERIQYLQNSLATLPTSERPQWHLEKELLAGADTSRLSEALLSQPLCTAVQIVLVDLLRAASITFGSVVGHSSGEIAAAYAADFISAHDAIRIAYYRGFHAQLAGDPSGQKGAMLAVGTSWEDAQDLLHLPVFRGRLKIAAHNSSASVTLSGNADAIVHAKKVFDEEKKFTRLLKVDTAYHSHHMLPCGDAYIKSLQACEIRVNKERNNSCCWYSSVISGKKMEPDEIIRDIYWKDNMENAVLFAEAVKSAVNEQQLNLALEIGPHPALKGPATQNISEVRSVLPYSGVLSRGNNDIEAFSDALGFIWTHLGSAAVDFLSYQKAAASSEISAKLLTGLPSYRWNRGRSHWHESRRSRKIRARPEAFHELLGVPSPDSTDDDRRWTNLLKVSEIPWLDGHRLQGQAVFPGSGYVAMALEAAKRFAGNRAVELFEIHDLIIPKAMTFEDDANFGVETLFTLRAITSNSSRDNQIQAAEFCCYICQNSGSDDMELIASGSVKIVFGSPSTTTLSSTPLDVSNMAAIDVDRFYSSLEALNYGYTGPFRTMSSLKRRLDQASALVSTYPYVDSASSYLVHPAVLDTSFQAALLAQSAPGDDRLWSLHVPTSIRCIRVNPELCTSLPLSMTQLPMCAVLHESKSKSICGSVDIFTEDGQQTLIQVEELTMIPFGPATAADDRRLFSYTKWDFAAPEGTSIVGHERPSLDEVELATLCERLSYFYLRKWKSEITDDEWTNGQRHYQSLRNFMDHMLSSISSGRHPYIKKEWSNDTVDVIDALIHNHPESVDMKLISAVGNNIPSVVRGQTTMLEHMLEDNMLDDLYKKGLGFVKYNSFLAKMVQQITHRYPHTKILEIGAGTGGATKTVLESIGNTFSSYTYTDISAGFFEKAAELFRNYRDKITFKILDIENTPTTQGFEAHSYDVIIASNVLHATSSLHKTLENTRRLLKPGGYLLLLEITNNGPIRYTNMMGGLPGWWVGVDDGRQYVATTTPAVWHNTLRKSGFSGVDAITREVDGLVWPFSIIATQAVNDRVDFLRRPLSYSSSVIYIDSLVILGTGSLETARIAEEVTELLGRFCGTISILEGLPTKVDAITPMSTFINLVDIDSPIFKAMNEEKMEGLKRLLELSKHILWLTAGAQADNPYHESSIAFSRAIGHEMPHILLNHLDVSELAPNVPTVIAEYLLSQCALDEWDAPTHQLLWSKEPEIHLDRGQLKVPRIVGHTDQNLRLNSARRVITKTVSTATSNISIIQSADSTPYLLEEILPVAPEDAENVIRVEKSSLMALNVAPDAFLFLSIGKTHPTRDTVLALSTTNSSMTVPIASVKLGADVDTSLIAVASELLAESLLTTMSSGSQLLVHEGGQDGFFTAALTRRAAVKQIRITFSTAHIDAPDPAWIKLNTRAPKHAIRRMLPASLTHCLDMTVTPESNFNIATVLPSTCRRLDLSNIFRYDSLQPTGGRELIQSRLEAVAGATISQEPQHLVIPLRQVTDTSTSKSPTTVISWEQDDALSVQVRPLDAGRLFSRDKTYLLVGLSGLTGQLGQSLCEWMIRNGAGYVCLASRNPNIDTQWLESFQGTGGIVKIFALDITNKNNLKRVVDEIRATCPPIAGIANAAMVLHDEMFSTMSLDKMQSALRPKIDGTNNLDELFYEDKLDFFILFSSLARVVGNSGQANYAAATGYLASLARQRRKRGVAGSTFDMGRVVGAGYVERAGQAVVDQLNKFGYMPISESEFHTMFAETIRAGYPELGAYPVVTTGLRLIRDDEEIKGPWFENPRFSHCIVETRGVDAKQDDKKTVLHVSEQLSNAANMEEVLEVIQECFSAKLRVILHISDEGAIDRLAPLSELGIDSLVAVEVRSWFLKELKVDMPVLKVLGGGSVADLSEYVIDKLPEKLLSSVGGGPAKAEVKQSKPELDSQGAESISASTSVPPTSSSPDESVTDFSSPSSADFTALVKPSTSLTGLIFSKSEQISFAQSRFWFLRLLLEDQTTFNVAFYYQVTGNLRIRDLDRAIRTLGTRHEALRTCFIGDESKADLAHQKVMNNSPLRLEHKNISRVEDVAVEYANLKAYAFDIASGDLMRVVLLTLSPTSHYLLFNYHHILMDGASYQIFLTELENAYNGASLGAAPRQFPDFSRSQREAFESGKMNDELQFWRGVFPDEPPILPLLPMARVSSRMPMERFDIHQVEYHFDPETAARVKSVAKAQRSTTFHFYLAVFKVMLFSFTDVKDLTIGIADANRNDSDVMDTIGFFLNLLTLRFSRHPEQQFADAITEARNTTYAALGNSRLPFDVLLKELNVPRSSAYSPFFQAFFDYRQGAQTQHTWSNCQFEVQEINPGRTAYDITLDVTDSATGALVMFRAQKGLYDLAATDLLLRTYVHLVDVLSNNTPFSLRDTPLFSEKELTHALGLGRGPNLTSSWPETLPHRIDQIAEKNQDKVALVDGTERVLTYASMINRIEAIAEALQNVGIGDGSRVLVFEDATVDWPCSMLAIMRIGAVYVPLDLRNPLPRLADVAANCQPAAILVDDSTIDSAPEINITGAQVVNVSRVGSKPSARVLNVARADSVAAILHSSGSTGKPKGIVVKHSGLRNEIEGYTTHWGLKAERVLQQSSFTFNHSSDQIYTGLVNAGMVHIVPWDKRGDALEITKIIQHHKITYTKATPSEYSMWIQYGGDNLSKASNWRFAFGGGEPLTSTVTQEFAGLSLPFLRFFNSYGPTEISISSHKSEVAYREKGPEGRIPCGYSLPNYVAYILDDQLKPLPAGMPGEVVIGGAGVSLGYLNNKELTDRQFVPDPYATPEYVANGWTNMYRTGDIGHLQGDGAMVFHNRITGDTQVKIRGLRIELTDIESNILSAAGGVLRDAVVTLREVNSQFLVAHVVFAPQHDVTDEEAFLQHLLSHLPLPQYMIPVLAIPLENLPLTNHSKVDRKAIKDLPLPKRTKSTEGDLDLELTETMVQLKRLWQDVLGNQEFGLDITPSASFFVVGGNSLLVIRLQSQIRDLFNVVVPLVALIGANTLGDMAQVIEESSTVDLIDWEKETTLSDLGPSIHGFASRLPIDSEQKTVLLTGATGFLAKYILAQLAAWPNVRTIHCVAVRDKGPKLPRKLPISSSKIVAHRGNLATPLLGLSEEEFQTLASDVDVILHMGAVRSFWDNYHVLRPTNVFSTRELIRLATPRQIPIHYISTAGVLPSGAEPDLAASVSAQVPAADGTDGYVASRWASEHILERAASELGLPTTVHRFVPSRSPNGGFELDEFVSFVDKLRIMPDFSGWEGRFDMFPAEQLAKWLCEALLEEQPRGSKAATRFSHHLSPITINVGEMRAYLEQQRGDRGFERLPGLRWMGRIKSLGFGYFMASQEVTVESSVGARGGTKFESRRTYL